jgi:hypothetical protein
VISLRITPMYTIFMVAVVTGWQAK